MIAHIAQPIEGTGFWGFINMNLGQYIAIVPWRGLLMFADPKKRC